MRGAALILVLAAAACGDRPPPASSPRPAPVARAGKVTTDAAIAAGNLDANIRAAERAGGSVEAKLTLASLLGMRAQFAGRAEDLERAATLTDEAVAAAPGDAKALLARAGARAALHRFVAARADVEAAARVATAADDLSWSIDALRATLDESVGRPDEALARRRSAAARWPGIDTLGALAAVEGDLGDREAARAHFAQALASYRDVSPFAVAYLELQEGLMWERAGMYARARGLYEAAHARLPGYVTVATHLAGVAAAMGDVDEAVVALEPLAATSTDPEVPGQLAGLQRRLHHDAAADALAARARAAYDALLARHPEAYADHAARFFLAAGADPARAHALAEQNLALRPTADATSLAIDAAVAAGDAAGACRHADVALGEPRPARIVVAAAERAYTACGRAL